MLLNKGELDGVRLLAPQTVEAVTARQRVGMTDLTFKQKVDWGLGFLTDSNHYGQPNLTYGYGPYSGPRTYGHSGSQSSTAFADPENGLVVGCCSTACQANRRSAADEFRFDGDLPGYELGFALIKSRSFLPQMRNQMNADNCKCIKNY